MSARLFIRKAARGDIAEAFEWYEERGTGLGHEFMRSLRVTLSSIQRSPVRYPVAEGDIRKALLARFPYVVYFVVLDHRVSVIAVMHTHRDPRRWSGRR